MTFEKAALPKPIYLDRVRISGGFWNARQTVNRATSIPAIYEQLDKTGRLDSWIIGKAPERRQPRQIVHMFWDSDTAKWIEAVGYSLQTHPDPALAHQADELISHIEAAQQPDGYLNTYFTEIEPEYRWKNLRDWHEMYNAGHLIEAAVAYYLGTGKSTLLNVLSRYADHIGSVFGPAEGQKRGYPGHPELELALVKLYRATGEQRYLDLSKYFIDERGQQPHYFDQEARERGEDPKNFWATTYNYCQAHQPLREQKTATGHSVRACYLYAGVADIALETGDTELLQLSRTLWDDLTRHQMYITGGLGPARTNEGFTFAYDLPNETAYAETCAGIALAFWAHRMFHIDPNSRYIDVMERAIYNNVLSGVSFDGDRFFYANPLAAYPNVNPTKPTIATSAIEHYRRQEWFFCPCCPPNVARLVASIGAYFYSVAADRLYVHLYNQNSAKLDLSTASVELVQQTNYPWDGRVEFIVTPDRAAEFELALRIPAWCPSYTLDVNGVRQAAPVENGYAIVRRAWTAGDRVVLDLAMPVERIAPHPSIREDAGRIALQRGPLIYCLEETDNGGQLANVAIPVAAPLNSEFDPALFGGVAVVTGQAVRIEPAAWGDELYQPLSRVQMVHTPFQFKAIPYFLWANREPGEMRVWIRTE